MAVSFWILKSVEHASLCNLKEYIVVKAFHESQALRSLKTSIQLKLFNFALMESYFALLKEYLDLKLLELAEFHVTLKSMEL